MGDVEGMTKKPKRKFKQALRSDVGASSNHHIFKSSNLVQPGILEMYFSISFIWLTICGVVGFSALALRKKSLAAR